MRSPYYWENRDLESSFSWEYGDPLVALYDWRFSKEYEDNLYGRRESKEYGDSLHGWPFLQEYEDPLYGKSSITSLLLTWAPPYHSLV